MKTVGVIEEGATLRFVRPLNAYTNGVIADMLPGVEIGETRTGDGKPYHMWEVSWDKLCVLIQSAPRDTQLSFALYEKRPPRIVPWLIRSFNPSNTGQFLALAPAFPV